MGSNVPDSAVSEIYTVRDLVDAVIAHAGGPNQRAARGWDEVISETPGEIERKTIDNEHPITCLPWWILRDTFFVGTSEIFGSALTRKLAEWIRLIPIDPDANLVPAMRAGAYGLRKKRVLVLFPEGERSIDGQPKIFRKGAAILAIHTQCPIVPAALEGFYEAWPRGGKFRGLSKLYVRFLDPAYPPPLGPNPESQYGALTAEVRSAIVAAYEELRAEQEKI